MSAQFAITKATATDALDVAVMVGELLVEIMNTTGILAFNFDLAETTARIEDYIDRERYFLFVARSQSGFPAGFISLTENYALYAQGAFGTIPELYVRPEHRRNKLGFYLVSQAKSFGTSRSWTRLEVTTPPLPEFEETLAFYEREGFSITGGRKLKISL